MDQARHAVCQNVTVVAVTRVSTFLVLKQWVVAECCKSHSHAALPVSPAGGWGELVAEAEPVQEGATGAAEHVHEISGMSVDTVCQDSGEEATQRHKTSRSQEQIDFRKLEAIKRRKKWIIYALYRKKH